MTCWPRGHGRSYGEAGRVAGSKDRRTRLRRRTDFPERPRQTKKLRRDVAAALRPISARKSKTGPALVDAGPRFAFDRGKLVLSQGSGYQYSHSCPEPSANDERDCQASKRAPIKALPRLIRIGIAQP